MKIIEMSEEQINNCIIFLNRTNLNGQEAEALVIIKHLLTNAMDKNDFLTKESREKNKNAGTMSSR